MEITISGKNKKHLRLVEDLAKELGLKIRSSVNDQCEEANGKALYELMEKMAEENMFSSIKDPAAWQREIRKDKPLYGRK